MSHPYGVASTQRGERTTSASGIHARRACAHQLDEPEQHREAGAEDDGAVEVRPDDEERQDEQRASCGRRGATRRRGARATPAKSGSAAVCARSVQPHGPARIARKPMTKVERDDAPPVRAVANDEAEREQDEGDPEEDHGAHAREPVGGVEDDLGEPLLVGPRASLAEDGQVLGVREAVLDDLASGHQRQPRVADDDRRREDREEDDPDQADEEDREGARLQDAADSAPVSDFSRTPESCASAWAAGVRLKSDTGGVAAVLLELTRESSRAGRRACLDQGLGSPATPADGPCRAV